MANAKPANVTNLCQSSLRIVGGRGRRVTSGMSLQYGMTDKKAAFLRSIGQNKEISASVHLNNLYEYSQHAVNHMLQLTKTGFKDEARTWVRIYSGSAIFPLLKDCGYDVAKLEEDFNVVRLACHPLDNPSFTNDLESINRHLVEILNEVKTLKASSAAAVAPTDLPVRHSGYVPHEN